jgi:hypothetical protein
MKALITITVIFMTILNGCREYSRGDRFEANFGDDSLLYVIAATGTGEKISALAAKMKFEHESKGNSCVVTYLTDSTELDDKMGLLLLNSILPDMEEDLLSKGFIGQFASRQIVSYLLVSQQDVGKYLIKKE